MVEVQVSFQAIRVARHDYVFIPKLRAICLLHRTAEVVCAHRSIIPIYFLFLTPA